MNENMYILKGVSMNGNMYTTLEIALVLKVDVEAYTKRVQEIFKLSNDHDHKLDIRMNKVKSYHDKDVYEISTDLLQLSMLSIGEERRGILDQLVAQRNDQWANKVKQPMVSPYIDDIAQQSPHLKNTQQSFEIISKKVKVRYNVS